MARRRSLGVVEQVKTAALPQHRLAASIGAVVGAAVPVITFTMAHHDHPGPLWSVQSAIVLGGLLFSAPTVFVWARRAFRDAPKAVGFVVLLEGVMLVSSIPWLTHAALVYLVAINAVATGCNLALERGAAAMTRNATAPKSRRRRTAAVSLKVA